jgi:hypothetical protein
MPARSTVLVSSAPIPARANRSAASSASLRPLAAAACATDGGMGQAPVANCARKFPRSTTSASAARSFSFALRSLGRSTWCVDAARARPTVTVSVTSACGRDRCHRGARASRAGGRALTLGRDLASGLPAVPLIA